MTQKQETREKKLLVPTRLSCNEHYYDTRHSLLSEPSCNLPARRAFWRVPLIMIYFLNISMLTTILTPHNVIASHLAFLTNEEANSYLEDVNSIPFQSGHYSHKIVDITPQKCILHKN